MQLSESDRELVWKLGAILRLADALDRSYESRVRDLNIRRRKEELTIEIISNTNCESELQAAERKKDMFQEAFKCNLNITQNVF